MITSEYLNLSRAIVRSEIIKSSHVPLFLKKSTSLRIQELETLILSTEKQLNTEQLKLGITEALRFYFELETNFSCMICDVLVACTKDEKNTATLICSDFVLDVSSKNQLHQLETIALKLSVKYGVDITSLQEDMKSVIRRTETYGLCQTVSSFRGI